MALLATMSCIHPVLYIYTGGIGGFMLSVFHKLETSKKTRKLQNLPVLKRNEVYTCRLCNYSLAPSVYAPIHVLVYICH